MNALLCNFYDVFIHHSFITHIYIIVFMCVLHLQLTFKFIVRIQIVIYYIMHEM